MKRPAPRVLLGYLTIGVNSTVAAALASLTVDGSVAKRTVWVVTVLATAAACCVAWALLPAHPGVPALIRAQRALLDLHPVINDPHHGCCTPPPRVCRPHEPECGSREHQLDGRTPWPCRSLRAAGIHSREDADRVREAVRIAEGGDTRG
jgi:hypothetical protein